VAGNEQFKRYVETGTAFIGMTQQRAEALVKDLVGSGEVARGQAQKAVDWLMERSRRGSEELTAIIRREVRVQIESLGLATTDDIARLEAKLAASARPSRAPTSRTAVAKAGRSAAPRDPDGSVKAAPAPPARAAPPVESAAPAKPVFPSSKVAKVPKMTKGGPDTTKAAPITKAAATRKPRTQPPLESGH